MDQQISRELLVKRLGQWDAMKASQKKYRVKRYAQMKLADSMRAELTAPPVQEDQGN